MSAADDQVQAGIGRALACIPSGLFVLTAGRGPVATGMLASFVMQAGFAPPAVTVAVRKGRPIEDLLAREGIFCLTVIAPASRGLLTHFARGFDPDEDAFAGLEMRRSRDGVPFPAGGLAHLECRVLGAADWSDHVVFCGEVVGGEGRPELDPLVHFRRNGYSY